MAPRDHSARRMPRIFGKLRTIILFGAFSASAAFADGTTPIVIIPPDATATMWTANAIDKVNRTGKFEQVALASYVLNAFVANPDLQPADVLRVLNGAQDTYSAQQRLAQSSSNYQFAPTEFDAMNSMLTVIGSVPGAGPYTTVAKEAVSWANRYTNATLGPEAQIIAQAEVFNSYSGAQAYQADTWSSLYQLAQANPQAAQVVNTFFGTYLHATTADSASSILVNNPDFAANQNIQSIAQMMGQDGSVRTSLDDLLAAAQRQSARMQSGFQVDLTLLKNIDQQQTVFAKYVTDQQARAALQADRQHQIDQLALQAADSGVYLLSTFAKLSGNNDAARTISVAGGAAIQVYKSVSEFQKSAAALGDAGQTLGSVVLTGNLVGAALNIVSLFSQSGPTVDQVILDQLQAIRKQIADLSQQMNDRFNRVDLELNQIYTTLNLGLYQVIGDVRQLDSKIDDVRSGLLKTEAKLNRLEQTLYSYLDAASRRQFKADIYNILTYKTNHPDAMPYDVFANYANELNVWSIDTSKDALEAGASVRSFDDAEIKHELSSLPLENNVNYLVQLVDVRLKPKGVQSLTTVGRLANPRDWEISSEAYIRLLSDWPESYRTISRNWQQLRGDGVFGIYSVGAELDNSIRAITLTPADATGKQRGNRALFDALIADYNSKADSYTQTMKTWERAFNGRLVPDPRKASANVDIDLWGDTHQSTSYAPSASQIAFPKGSVPVPDGFISLVPSVFRLAEQLGIGTVEVDLAGSDYYSRPCKPGEPYARPPWKHFRGCCDCQAAPPPGPAMVAGHTRITLEAVFRPNGQQNAISIFKRTWTSPGFNQVLIADCGTDSRLDCYQAC
jgi:hypothetical protein